MIELLPHPNGLDWIVRVSVATLRDSSTFAVFRRACDWGLDRLRELEDEAGFA